VLDHQVNDTPSCRLGTASVALGLQEMGETGNSGKYVKVKYQSLGVRLFLGTAALTTEVGQTEH
jgi:hypothetical protein